MATGGEIRYRVSGNDIAYLVQHVYKELIIKHVRVGRIIGRLTLPEEHHETVNEILAHEAQLHHELATRTFLRHLESHGQPADYSHLLQLMEQEDYKYLPRLLRGEETLDLEHHQLHCRLIQFFSEDISAKVDQKLLFRKLVEGQWMDDDDAELLRRLSENTGRTVASRWLTFYVLPRKKESWLKQFLQILTDLDYPDLRDWITGQGEYSEEQNDMEVDCDDDDDDGDDDDDDDDKTMSPYTSDEESVKMNILSGVGEAYSSVNNLYEPNIQENFLLNKRGPNKYNRTNYWAETTIKQKGNYKSDSSDDESVLSSVFSNEDNTLEVLGIEGVSHEISEIRAREITPLETRPYQDELVSSARDGQNVIIIAPTGSGKTVVAIRIIQEHLQRLAMGSRKGKVAFFANEVSLVDQQHELCRGHLEKSISTTQIVGEIKDMSKMSVPEIINTDDKYHNSKEFAGVQTSMLVLTKFPNTDLGEDRMSCCSANFGTRLKRKHDVLFMTPQIVVDAVLDKSLQSLEVFSLLIFDECHHVNAKHPANKVMHCYLDTKLEGSTNLPQVVGLTASVGVGGSKTRSTGSDAKSHIRGLCSRLDTIGGLATVRDNIDNLNKYTNFVEQAIELSPERTHDTFKECVVTCIMEPIEQEVQKLEGDSGLAISLCKEKGTMAYKQWLAETYYNVIPAIKNLQVRRNLYTFIQHLIVYNTALIINQDCRAEDALLSIKQDFRAMYQTEHSRHDTDRWLRTLYKENYDKLKRESKALNNTNPKLKLLQLYITEQIREKPGSKILILVKMRNLTSALQRWMKQTDVLQQLNPVVVTGCAPRHKGGMLKAQRLKAVQGFKWGNHFVAIATSLAEEGLDLKQCHKVIRYEYVSNEIGMVQARGRASRVEDGSYSLITADVKKATREEQNVRLESVMKEAVSSLQREFDHDPEEFRLVLLHLQREDKKVREKEERNKNQQRQLKDPNAFAIHCMKCDVRICWSFDIRVVNGCHNMVMTSNIGQLVYQEAHGKPTKFDGIQKVDKIHCKSADCHTDWGSVFIYKDSKFAVLTPKHLIFYDPNGKQYPGKTWKEAPFSRKAMTDEDLAHYESSLQ